MNTKKTLADVKHGGCVQLGDGPWPEIDAILADAFSAGAEGLQFGGIARRAAVRAAVAALSAQPSPGGQDALKALDDLAAFCSDDTATVDRHVAVIRAALAARQPVGKRPMEMRICELRHVSLKPNRPYVFTVDANCAKCRADAAYALGHTDTKPAQAVDLGPVRDVFRRWHANELNSTDAMLALVEALAVIDSQAVGNG